MAEQAVPVQRLLSAMTIESINADCKLLTLPTELRIQIYEEVIRIAKTVVYGARVTPLGVSLAMVCKQLHAEYLPVVLRSIGEARNIELHIINHDFAQSHEFIFKSTELAPAQAKERHFEIHLHLQDRYATVCRSNQVYQWCVDCEQDLVLRHAKKRYTAVVNWSTLFKPYQALRLGPRGAYEIDSIQGMEARAIMEALQAAIDRMPMGADLRDDRMKR